MRWKYIIVLDKGEEVPIIFPKDIEHVRVWSDRDNIISAGFVDIFMGFDNKFVVTTYGESISLKLKSRKKDSGIIELYIQTSNR